MDGRSRAGSLGPTTCGTTMSRGGLLVRSGRRLPRDRRPWRRRTGDPEGRTMDRTVGGRVRSFRDLGVTLGLILATQGCDGSSPGAVPDGVELWAAVADLTVTDPAGVAAPMGFIGSLAVTDGWIALSQPRTREIWLLTPEGDLAWKAGGEGDGPGEFRSLGRLGWRGRTLYAADPVLQRVTYLDREGNVVRVQRWTPPSLASGYFSSGPWKVFSDGTAATLPGYAADALAAHVVRDVPLLRVSSEGAVLDTLALISQEGSQIEVSTGDRRWFIGHPFNDAPLFGFPPTGDGVVVVERRAPTDPRTAGFRVTRVSGTGDTVYSRWYEHHPEPLDARTYDEAISRIRRDWGGEGAPFSRTDLERHVPRPRYRSPVTSLRVDVAGRAWLRGQPRDDERVGWTVIDADGAVRANVLLPVRFTLLHAGADALYGTLPDEFDVPALVRYRLERE